jgi:uncharacterized protein YdeI (YjbR/CyaY-like superfamily)
MQLTHIFHAPDRSTWRSWLEENHTSSPEVWLVYYKSHTGQPSISYDESVEEALCFGWIDSLIQKIDEDRYARKFTPRRPGSPLSDTNKRRVSKIIAEGRMTPTGLAKIDYPPDEPPAEPIRQVLVIPEWISLGLKQNTNAWENFSHLPPSHKKRYIAWLSSAKKEETRLRNLEKAIRLLEQNIRLEMNTRTGG